MTEEIQSGDEDAPDVAVSASVTTGFGKNNRERLLSVYFGQRGRPNSASAWQHVYRLLLWIDRTTGLAHCYESDKSQPGRPWYSRSLAFHAWVANALSVSPSDLGSEIDWMFKHVIKDIAASILGARERQAESATTQRAPYEQLGMPKPGEDPDSSH